MASERQVSISACNCLFSYFRSKFSYTERIRGVLRYVRCDAHFFQDFDVCQLFFSYLLEGHVGLVILLQLGNLLLSDILSSLKLASELLVLSLETGIDSDFLLSCSQLGFEGLDFDLFGSEAMLSSDGIGFSGDDLYLSLRLDSGFHSFDSLGLLRW